jgi:hypothetical protein
VLRKDVEQLFVHDRIPAFVITPCYDRGRRPGELSMNIQIQPEFDASLLFVEELRIAIVQTILEIKIMGVPPIQPFTVVKAHEHMGNCDLRLDSLLVNDEFEPLLVKARQPVLGHQLKLFGHPEVPPGEVYGLAQPEYVGVIPIQNGLPGVALTNLPGLIWGRFQLRDD